jgi:N-acyl-D-amino-acid deacylase
MTMMHRAKWGLSLALVATGAWTTLPAQTPPSTLIRNVRVIDGTGTPSYVGAVRMNGAIIAVVDRANRIEPIPGERVIDGTGLALAPGFIDTHSHHDRSLTTAPDALAMVSQGITTIVVGQDGGGQNLADLFGRLDRQPASVNVAAFAGHGPLREKVMGDDTKRKATPDEIERMKPLLQAELDAGALGLSTGLEYDPGIYSDPSEVLALAKVAGDAGGRYASHIRSEDRDFWQALDEVITIGRVNTMPVQVSHIKLGMLDLWGQAAKAIHVLDRARASGVNVVADIYPYTYWQSNLGVFFPKRNFADRAEATFVLEHVTGAKDIIFNSYRAHPDYEGKTLADVAALRKTSEVQTLLDLLAEPGGSGVSIVARGMADADVERLIQWPWANVCSDGQSTGLHPRGSGSFPKVLGPYVRDKQLFSLERAVYKMTRLAAANVGLRGRGDIVSGQAADLVLFDPATVADRADFGRAQATAVGIRTVWVNGQAVYDGGPSGSKTTGVHSGWALRRYVRRDKLAASQFFRRAPWSSPRPN